MCGRFTLFADFKTIVERFDIEAAIQADLYHPSYNIAPSHSVLSVINDGTRNRMGYLKWGLIPSWSKDEKIGNQLMNARAETLMEKPSFRTAFMKRRCLIIADSFYEWNHLDPKRKTPIRFLLKSNKLFAMAGLWEHWKSPDGHSVYSCTIITTSANHLMKKFHNRMPVILKPEDEQKWLNPSNTDMKNLSDLLKPLPEDLMEAYEVSNLVNSTKNNSPKLIEKMD